MVGDEVADKVTINNNNARDNESMVYLGPHGDGVPVWLNKIWVEADIRITTGFVEPHFFAGFSGGPKTVAPGLAGLETGLTPHDAQRIGDPRATGASAKVTHYTTTSGRWCRQWEVSTSRSMASSPRPTDREGFRRPGPGDAR